MNWTEIGGQSNELTVRVGDFATLSPASAGHIGGRWVRPEEDRITL